MRELDVLDATAADAEDMAAVIRRAFGSRPPLVPESDARHETAQIVAAALDAAGGLIVRRRDQPVGALLFDDSRPGLLGLRRVSVEPEAQGHGVASAMVGVAETVAGQRGKDGVWLHVRNELPQTVRFWRRRDYHEAGREGHLTELRKTLGATVGCPDADATRALAGRLAPLLRAGDLLVLTGDLGAGKTTFTQGLGAALGVEGPVTSPTFIVARSHASAGDGPGLLHVDAYRLADAAELDDLDLDAYTATAVTVVEWGAGRAEQLADSRIDIALTAPDPATDRRLVTVVPRGPRWIGVPLRSALVGRA